MRRKWIGSRSGKGWGRSRVAPARADRPDPSADPRGRAARARTAGRDGPHRRPGRRPTREIPSPARPRSRPRVSSWVSGAAGARGRAAPGERSARPPHHHCRRPVRSDPPACRLKWNRCERGSPRARVRWPRSGRRRAPREERATRRTPRACARGFGAVLLCQAGPNRSRVIPPLDSPATMPPASAAVAEVAMRTETTRPGSTSTRVSLLNSMSPQEQPSGTHIASVPLARSLGRGTAGLYQTNPEASSAKRPRANRPEWELHGSQGPAQHRDRPESVT